MDFSADGRCLVASCEFSGQMLRSTSSTRRVLGTLSSPAGAMPQDVKLTPEGGRSTWPT